MENKKYPTGYISYGLQEKECYSCLEVLPFSEFGISHEEYPTSNCKKCHIKNTAQGELKKKLKMFPNNHQQCESPNCDFIWKIKVHVGRSSFYKPMKVKFITRCPDCGQESRRVNELSKQA